MGYINKIQLDESNAHLIEPTLYASSSTLTSSTYSITLDSTFTLTTGVAIQVKFTTTNPANATLKINNAATSQAIYYENSAIQANVIKVNHIYNLVYDGTRWNIIGDIDTDTTYSSLNAAENGTDVSLVQTGEKYIWNNKANIIVDDESETLIITSGAGSEITYSYANNREF